MTINTEHLALLDGISLESGAHTTFDDGHCAMEVVAWLAGEAHTDAPSCASPVLRRYTIRLNDRWSTEQRQSLKPFLRRMVGTGGDGLDDARVAIATRMLCTDLLGPWLRLAGMDERADALTSLVAATPEELRRVLRGIRNEAWRRRDASRDQLKAKILERLKARGIPVAVAVADAAAAAAAVAVAVAVAAADADAAADAAADGQSRYWAAYYAARDYFKANPLPVMARIRELNAQQAPLALQLLDAMIAPEVA